MKALPVGLMMVQHLTEFLGGELRIGSDDKNSRYWLSLPFHIESTSVNKKGNIEQQRPELSLLTNQRILIVDDNETCRKVLGQQCLQLDLDVQQASNATSAMALWRTENSHDRPFDIVILDHSMPGISGMQLARRIARETDETGHVRPVIIMLTGCNPSS